MVYDNVVKVKMQEFAINRGTVRSQLRQSRNREIGINV